MTWGGRGRQALEPSAWPLRPCVLRQSVGVVHAVLARWDPLRRAPAHALTAAPSQVRQHATGTLGLQELATLCAMFGGCALRWRLLVCGHLCM